MQKKNIIILFPITFLLYVLLVVIFIQYANILGNNITTQQKIFSISAYLIAWLAIFVVITIFALYIILKSNIEKKWKVILSISWTIFTPIYFVIYCVKFKKIFEKELMDIDPIVNKINRSSLFSFIVLITTIILAISTLIIEKSSISSKHIINEWVGWFTIALIVVYFFSYTYTTYCSNLFSEKIISYMGKIPFACSFVWMYSNKIIKNKM